MLKGKRLEPREGERVRVLGVLRVIDPKADRVNGALVPGWVEVRVEGFAVLEHAAGDHHQLPHARPAATNSAAPPDIAPPRSPGDRFLATLTRHSFCNNLPFPRSS